MKQQSADVFGRILAHDQQADGSFLSCSTSLGGQFEAGGRSYKTTFVSALIAGALAGIRDRRLERICQQAADFLIIQHGPKWSFNYWSRDEPEAKLRQYPDDWDDTSCAVIALTRLRSKAVTGELLGHIVALLTQTETQEGGPYRTWMVARDAPEHWLDVDIAVNANIAYMLKLHGVDLPNLELLADEHIANGRLSSLYYPSRYPIEYFLSRWYRGRYQAQLLEQILERLQAGHWDNPLDAALMVSAALNLGATPAAVAEAASWLRSLDEADVRPHAICLDPAIDGQPYVAGSRALTAAFCLEALAKYDEAASASDEGKPTAPSVQTSDYDARMHEQVITKAMARLQQCGEPIRDAADRIRERLLSGTAASQITVLPSLFRQSIGANGKTISDDRMVSLGLISLYGWMAYTIYDDFLDEEGAPPMLPLANVALRELILALHQEAARTAGFGEVAWAILDRQEAANAWEVTHCRVRRQADLTRVKPPQFSDLHVLAERSMGHALGCLAITMELGYEPHSTEVQAIQAFFYHFLIARQLSDDAHDWKEDLRKGQINAVGAYLLHGIERRGPSVQALYAQLEQYFWDKGIGEVNIWIFRELAQARASLKDATFIDRPEILEALLAPIEETARKAEEEQRQTADFLRAYRPETH